MAQSKHWCFTLNNWTQDEFDAIEGRFGDASIGIQYLVVGRERGENGTPHLQGFISFDRRRRLRFVKGATSNRAHLEAARGTPQQASDYCKKDGDFIELGDVPSSQGSRSDIDNYREWIFTFFDDNGRHPNEREIVAAHTSLFMRYSRTMLALPALLLPTPVLAEGTLNDWQQELYDELQDGEFNDREIKFYVDVEGGKGKTWMCQYLLSNMHDTVQVLSVGKRDDLAHCLDTTKTIFLFNIPRGSMEYLQYGILEGIKDRMVLSPKYNSALKVFPNKTAVIVFSNEQPDETKLSADRVVIKNL